LSPECHMRDWGKSIRNEKRRKVSPVPRGDPDQLGTKKNGMPHGDGVERAEASLPI